MITPSEIMKSVQRKIEALGHVNEEQIHEFYRTAMWEALRPHQEEIERHILELHALFTPDAHHPDQGWRMYSRAHVEKISGALEAMIQQLRMLK